MWIQCLFCQTAFFLSLLFHFTVTPHVLGVTVKLQDRKWIPFHLCLFILLFYFCTSSVSPVVLASICLFLWEYPVTLKWWDTNRKYIWMFLSIPFLFNMYGDVCTIVSVYFPFISFSDLFCNTSLLQKKKNSCLLLRKKKYSWINE